VGRKEEILEKVRAIAAPLASAEGLELVDVELAGAGGRSTLRLFIDKDGGVSLDDCSSVSRAVSAALDVEDPIDGAYDLEVSSPGLDRPLRVPEHFRKFAGEKVRVKAYAPIPELENRKTFVGTLDGFEDGRVLVEVDGKVFPVPLEQVAKAHVEPTLAELEGKAAKAPDAILTIDGRHVSGGKDTIRAALKEARKGDRAEIWARREEGALCGLFRNGQALLTLDDVEGSPAWTSRAKHAVGGEARISFARADGEAEEVPASWAVPAEDAARALEHFFLTGQRPSFITWHDETKSS